MRELLSLNYRSLKISVLESFPLLNSGITKTFDFL